MRNTGIGFVGALVLTSIATFSCSSSGGNAGTAGSPGTGGTAATGGSSGTGAAAVGGSSTSSGGSVTTLSGAKSLGSLTASEATQLCTDTYGYYGRVITRASLCKASGLTFSVSSSAPDDTTLQQNCKSRESTCLTNSNSPTCSNIPQPCTATIAEYSTCVTDIATAFGQGVAALAGCATVTRNDLSAVWDFSTAPLPSSCTSLDATCPGLDVPIPHD